MDQITHYDVTVIDNNNTVQTDETEHIADIDEPLVDVLETSILNAITHINKNKKRADIDAIFEYISKSIASNITRELLNASLTNLIDNKVLYNKKTPKGHSFKITEKQDETSDNPKNDNKSFDITPNKCDVPNTSNQDSNSISHKDYYSNDLKIIDDKIVENNFQINNLKQLVDKELNTIKHFLNSMPSKTNNNIVSDLKDEINFLKNELASKNKIIEILHENYIRCNDISTQQNFKNIDEFQTIRTSSRVNSKANQANEFALPTSNRYQCFDTTDKVIFSTKNEKINDNDNYRKPTPIQTSSNKGSDVRKRPSFIPNNHEENQQNFRKRKQPSKTYSEAVNSENCRAKKKTIIFTDSIPKGIRRKEFNNFIKNGTAQMKCFPGATSKDLNYYVIPTLENNSYDQVLIHVGINDLLNSDKPDHQSLLQNIMSVIQKCKDSGIAEIIISLLVVTEEINVRVIIGANESLRNFCRQNGFNFIDNRNIPPTKLYRDRLHLIESGKKILANNFIHGINNYFQVTNFPTNIF